MIAKPRPTWIWTHVSLALLAFIAFLEPAAGSASQLTATWVDNSYGVAATRLERRQSTESVYIALADVPPGVTSYLDASVSAGTTYCYRAFAYDAEGVSPYSQEACALAGIETYALNVAVHKSGDGAGTVNSTPAGIVCGTECSAGYVVGSAVALTATAAPGSTFVGWSGGCAGTAECVIAGNGTVIVTATFTTATLTTPSTFVDVPSNHQFAEWIEALVAHGIANGCSANPPLFCPDAAITRIEMAIMLLRGRHGPDYVPPDGDGMFSDVPVTGPFARWIEELAREGITVGCGIDPARYCPAAEVTRGQMAVFLLRAKHGGSYEPPAAVGMFIDVPASHPFAPWIEQLAREGITGGCGLMLYCPWMSVTRGQMSVFLARAFGLPI